MNIIVIDGKEYHADDEGIPYKDQAGELIPAWQCICHAWEVEECCCGAWYKSIEE